MNLLKSAATALLFALTTLICAAPAAAQTVEYVHTDALGSVVAVTDANRNIVERREYEPYGYQLTPTLQNGPGYTGHVQDAATGLTYMQQRYYDPLLGRFLSVDPVTMHDNGDPRLFNRYGYAANNPYTFVDPDGRIFGVLGKVVKLAIKGGDIAATVAGAVEDAGVLFSSDATAGERLAAAASLATEVLSPVSARDAKAGYRAIAGSDDAAKGGLAEAREARDALSAELAPLKGRAPATVTGGYNVQTGEVAARACGGGKCAENHVVDALGGDKGDVRFTEAVRPRTGAEVPVCPRCEATFGREPFPPNTRFKTDE
jgi:RHS repeat-associated protein